MLYVLAAVAEKYSERFDIHEVLFMSNHMHLVATDRTACLPAFMRELNSLISRQLNALRGTTGTNFESGCDYVIVQDDKTLMRHIVYTLANPCAAGIVERVQDWAGVNSLGLDYGVPLPVSRPPTGLWSEKCEHKQRTKSIQSKRANFAGKTRMPETARLVLVRPAIRRDLDDLELRELIRAKLRDIEDRRMRTRGEVIGMERALRQSFMAIPPREERFGMTPSFSASSVEARRNAARMRREFIDSYREALMKFASGVLDAVFPKGTWMMVHRFGVAVDTG